MRLVFPNNSVLPAKLRTQLITYLLIYLLTYLMEQSPFWDANRFSASQQIPLILWNPKVHNRIHKCPPPVSIKLGTYSDTNHPEYKNKYISFF
jgi:hypothetical protein